MHKPRMTFIYVNMWKFLLSPILTFIPNIYIKNAARDFPGGAVVKNLPANAGDTGSSPGPGRSHMLRSN